MGCTQAPGRGWQAGPAPLPPTCCGPPAPTAPWVRSSWTDWQGRKNEGKDSYHHHQSPPSQGSEGSCCLGSQLGGHVPGRLDPGPALSFRKDQAPGVDADPAKHTGPWPGKWGDGGASSEKAVDRQPSPEHRATLRRPRASLVTRHKRRHPTVTRGVPLRKTCLPEVVILRMEPVGHQIAALFST